MAQQRTSRETTFLARSRDGLDRFASASPARFAIMVFAAMNLLFMALLMTPWATATGVVKCSALAQGESAVGRLSR